MHIGRSSKVWTAQSRNLVFDSSTCCCYCHAGYRARVDPGHRWYRHRAGPGTVFQQHLPLPGRASDQDHLRPRLLRRVCDRHCRRRSLPLRYAAVNSLIQCCALSGEGIMPQSPARACQGPSQEPILVALPSCAGKRCARLAYRLTCAGLPVSTTQTVCGALLAIGLMEGLKGVNWWACLRVRF